MERLAAVTHLVASLEYLVRDRDRRWGGFNNWAVSRRNFPVRFRLVGGVLDALAGRRLTVAMHLTRIAAALSFVAPAGRRRRLAADAVLAGTTLSLYPRHHYGTDGSDQVAFLVQTAATAARAGQRRPRVVDACLWYVALQSVLSYAVSGWVKLASPTWRSGTALVAITRTLTYGDRAAWELLHRHPRMSRVLGVVVLTMECSFPAVFLARGRFAPLIAATATVFHLGNARIMGLGRFVWSFVSMHPAVLYASGPQALGTRTGGNVERRDDTFPLICGLLVSTSLAVGLIAQYRRRPLVARAQNDRQELETTAGNVLSFRLAGPPQAAGPVIILESGLLSTIEHWEWVVRGLTGRSVATYERAGYGCSTYARGGEFRLAMAVRDLVELIDHVAPDRSVVLVGHSLGGWLALLAASERADRVQAVVLLDSSHPAELQRSSRQAQGEEALSSSVALMPVSLRLGLGLLVKRPEWVDRMPESVRPRALAQFRDPRIWTAGRREWRTTLEEFRAFDGRMPDGQVPRLVVTAGYTALRDEVQLELHEELAAEAPGSERHTIEGADHDSMLTEARFAAEVVQRITEFVDALNDHRDAPAGDEREDASADEPKG
jgi:pimeloyl-ACP methyl ester carboxylesterase